MRLVFQPRSLEILRALLGSGIARASGLAMAVVVAALFGANADTDGMYLALGVTLYAFEILRISVEGAVIPAVTGLLRHEQSRSEALIGGWARHWLIWSSISSLLIVALAVTMSSSFDSSARRTLQYGTVLVPLVIPMGLAALGSSVLVARKRFLTVRAADSARPLGAVLGAFFFHERLGLWAVIGGYGAGVFVQVILVFVLVWGSGFRPRLTGSFHGVLDQLALLKPIVAGSLLLNLNPIVDRIATASMLEVGGVTIYENAARMFTAMMSLCYGSIGVVLVRHWSDLRAQEKFDELTESFRRLLRLTFYVLLPASIVVIAGAGPLFGLVLGRGAYGQEEVALTVAAFIALVLGVVPFFLAAMGSRLLYALEATRIALTVGLVAVPVNLILDVLLAPVFGLVGIAASTSLTYALVSLVVLREVRNRLRQVSYESSSSVIPLSIVSSELT